MATISLSWAATLFRYIHTQLTMWWSALVSDDSICSAGLPDNSSSGQRYHVVVNASPKDPSGANSTKDAFWIRIYPANGCSGFNPAFGQPDERQGIIYYGNNPQPLPTTLVNNYTGYNLACRDEPYEKLVPVVPWTIGKPSNTCKKNIVSCFRFSWCWLSVDQSEQEQLHVGLQSPVPGQGQGHPRPNDKFNHWAIGERPLWLNFSNPTILNLNNKTFNPDYVVVPENYPEGSWVYLIVTENFTNPLRRPIAAHPVSQLRQIRFSQDC